jgi:hypothetical protein
MTILYTIKHKLAFRIFYSNKDLKIQNYLVYNSFSRFIIWLSVFVISKLPNSTSLINRAFYPIYVLFYHSRFFVTLCNTA